MYILLNPYIGDGKNLVFSSGSPELEKLSLLKIVIDGFLDDESFGFHLPLMKINEDFLPFLSDLYLKLSDVANDEVITYHSDKNDSKIDFIMSFKLSKGVISLEISYDRHFDDSDDFEAVKSYVDKLRYHEERYEKRSFSIKVVDGNIADFCNRAKIGKRLVIRGIRTVILNVEELRKNLPKLMYLVENNKELEDKAEND